VAALRELVLGLLAGASVFAGLRLAEKLADPYGPRLTVTAWLENARGGDTA